MDGKTDRFLAVIEENLLFLSEIGAEFLTKEVSPPTVEERILSCQECPLSSTRTKAVPGEGNTNADLMFIGEAPGRDEDIQGRPFVGRAGQLLTKIIQAMNYNREDVYITNIVKCRPPNNRDPNRTSGEEDVMSAAAMEVFLEAGATEVELTAADKAKLDEIFAPVWTKW